MSCADRVVSHGWPAAMGAEVAGIDAAEDLIDVAVLRNPNGDIRLGSMFELPWADQSFDVVISINGIWGGNQAALDEAHRVLKPGGGIGISFWGAGPPLDLRPVFKVFVGHSPETHVGGMRDLNNIAFEGVAERMLTEAGFIDLERGSRIAVLEWPDPDIVWRAMASIGPVVPRSSTPITRCSRRKCSKRWSPAAIVGASIASRTTTSS